MTTPIILAEGPWKQEHIYVEASLVNSSTTSFSSGTGIQLHVMVLKNELESFIAKGVLGLTDLEV